MKRFSISVVIPNYNGRNLLKTNLPPLLKALKQATDDFEIIISDDASTDDSITFLKLNFPQVKLIENKENKGFSPTINKGIMACTKDLLFALNSDVVITEGYFEPQFKYFEKQDTFGVMGRIIGLTDDSIQDGAKYPQMNGLKIKSTINYLPEVKIENLPTLFLSGANALMDTKKVQSLHGFNEIYAPFYVEDVDLSIRAWRLGWKCYYEHDSICRHPSSTTILAYHKKKKVKIVSLKNRLIFHAIHLSGLKLYVWKIQVFIEVVFSLLKLQNHYIKAYQGYLRKRNEIQLSRQELELSVGSRKLISLSEVIKGIYQVIERNKITKF